VVTGRPITVQLNPSNGNSDCTLIRFCDLKKIVEITSIDKTLWKSNWQCIPRFDCENRQAKEAVTIVAYLWLCVRVLMTSLMMLGKYRHYR
jgi:hypothetical protein